MGWEACWDHHVATEWTQKDLRVEDELGGAQVRLWCRGAGGFGEEQLCMLGGATVGTALFSGCWLERSRCPGWAWDRGRGLLGWTEVQKTVGPQMTQQGQSCAPQPFTAPEDRRDP